MKNRRYFYRKIKFLSRLIILGTGFFVFLCIQNPKVELKGSVSVPKIAFLEKTFGEEGLFKKFKLKNKEAAQDEQDARVEDTGDKLLLINETPVCLVESEQQAQKLVAAGRRRLLESSEGLPLCEARISLQSPAGFDVSAIPGVKDEEGALNATYLALSKGQMASGQKAYAVKINELCFYLKDEAQVIDLLTEAKNRYDKEGQYRVILEMDRERPFYALTAVIDTAEEEEPQILLGQSAGAGRLMEEMTKEAGADAEIALGLKNLRFADEVEVAECYVSSSQLSDFQEAVKAITEDKIKEQIYEVQPGDTLSQIAVNNDTTIEDLVAINEGLAGNNPTIRIGDELRVTVPEPELSFVRVQEEYYEENFEAPIQYVDNDDWYTTKEETLQDPIAGFHKVVADITYRNDQEENRVVKAETIVAEATPKIVEKGTKQPPTFIRPISGGRTSSPFGKRAAPKKGASTYHKGIDWAIPVGTAVMASSSGVVSRAGWGSGYGNVVYIDHPDGRQTRYGHLSKVLVSVGQKVNGGEKIALTGNTGRSTGPHIHFELLINGEAVNPLNYFN